MHTMTKMEQQRIQKAREEYLTTQVATASPAQLTLMLFDGADRYLQAAVALLHAGVTLTTASVVTEALGRAGSIVSQFLATLDVEVWPEGQQLADLYLWIADEFTQINVAKRILPALATSADREVHHHLAERAERARVMLFDIAAAFRGTVQSGVA